MTAYDVTVADPDGDTVNVLRVEAKSKAAARTAALALCPAGWEATEVSDEPWS